MKSRLAIPLIASALALLAAGCSGSSSAPQGQGGASTGAAAAIPLLRVGDDAALTSALDVGQDEGNDVYGALETLTKFGPAGQVEAELAASVSHPNATTYVYRLRQGVKFWNGDPMTSADVVNALDYYRQPGSYVSTELTSVKSVAADGPEAVVITLKYPYAPWDNETTGQFPIFEKKFQDEHKTTMGQPGTLIMGTGPFEIDSFDPTTGLELSANPHWWGGTVPVKHISVKFFSTETSEALAMRSGEIDVAFPQDGKTFASVSGTKLTSFSAPGVSFFAMDANVGPWADAHVRRAVAYALNRTDLIAANGGPVTARPTSQIIQPAQLLTIGTPSQVNSLLNSLPQYPHDLDKARQEMAESAYPHGFTAVTEVGSLTNYPTVVQAIAAELRQIGISLKIQEVSITKYLTDYSASSGPPGGDMYGGLGAVSPDPSILPSYMVGSAATYNVARYMPTWSNPLLASGLATSDPARRLAIYGQLLKQVDADIPYVPLFSGYSFVALSSKYTLPPFPDYAAFSSWALNLKQAAS